MKGWRKVGNGRERMEEEEERKKGWREEGEGEGEKRGCLWSES